MSSNNLKKVYDANMKFALGTAAFTNTYGITNKTYADHKQVQQLLDVGVEQGVSYLDTAAAYGQSETTLGLCAAAHQYDIITKVGSCAQMSVQDQLQRSLQQLQCDRVYAVLLHDETMLLGEHAPRIYDALQELQSRQLVQKIGVSFYNPDIAERTLEQFDLDLIQAPANILDRRFEQHIFPYAKQAGVEIHSRSLFLQGLLAVCAAERAAPFQNQADLLKFDQAAKTHGLTPLELAVSVLTEQPSIDCTIVGCLTPKQLIEIMQAYRKMTALGSLNLALESHNTRLLDPTQWSHL